MTRPLFYAPDGTPLPDSHTWATRYEENRHVRDTRVGRYRISTVYLGLDHSFGSGPPLIYETMVFDQGKGAHKWADIECDRYATYDQALNGHKAKVAQFAKRGRKVVEYELDLMEDPAMIHPVHILVNVEIRPVDACEHRCHTRAIFWPRSASSEALNDGVVAAISEKDASVTVVKYPEGMNEIRPSAFPIEICMN